MMFGSIIGGLSWLIFGCGKKSPTEPLSPPDIILEGDEEKLAKILQGQLEKLNSLVQNQSQTLQVGIGGGEILAFSVSNDNASYPHLKIVRESTGKAVHLLWGSKNLFPSIKFVEDSGEQLVEIGLNEVSGGDTPRDWLKTGIKVLALALVIWLGASIGKAILAAIAFLAFNAMVLALLVLAVAILAWIADKFGWTTDDVYQFFKEAIEKLIEFLKEVADFLKRPLLVAV
ncbi:MAG: hypothetical protein AB1352_00560 [Patescibacteria group bacterium]